MVAAAVLDVVVGVASLELEMEVEDGLATEEEDSDDVVEGASELEDSVTAEEEEVVVEVESKVDDADVVLEVAELDCVVLDSCEVVCVD